MSQYPRYHAVYEDGTLSRVERLIATDGPGAGFRLVEDPATVRHMAAQFGEVSVYDHDLVPS